MSLAAPSPPDILSSEHAADHLSFAMGRHYCVGAMLAQREVDVAPNHPLDHMENLAFKDGFEPFEEGVFTRAPETLEITFTPARG